MASTRSGVATEKKKRGRIIYFAFIWLCYHVYEFEAINPMKETRNSTCRFDESQDYRVLLLELEKKLLFLTHPLITLTTKEMRILGMSNEFFDPFFQKDRILTPFHVDNRWSYLTFRKEFLDRFAYISTRERIFSRIMLGKKWIHIFMRKWSNEEKSYIMICPYMFDDECCKVHMEVFCLCSEFSHISKETEDSMCGRKWKDRFNPPTEWLVPTVVTPIDDDRLFFALKNWWSSCLWEKFLWTFLNMKRINPEEKSDSENREYVFYLISSECGERNRVGCLLEVYLGIYSRNCHMHMWGVYIRHSSHTIVESVSIDILSQSFIDNKSLRMLCKEEFRISIGLECSELFDMVWCNRRDDTNIWMRDGKKELHLTWSIDSIFENQIWRIRSK